MNTALASDGFVLTTDVLYQGLDSALAQVQPGEAVGAHHFTIPVRIVQDDKYSDEQRWDAPDLHAQWNALLKLGAELKARGHTFTLMPFLYALDFSWRGEFEPRDFEKWSASYRSKILELTDWAIRSGASELILATELCQIHRRPDSDPFFRELYQAVKAKTLQAKIQMPAFIVANWDQWDLIRLWDSSDYIGLSSYYPLDEKNLEGSWQTWRAKLLGLAQKYNRKLYFAELGYPSLDSAAREPWAYDPTPALNLSLQSHLFEVFGNVWAGDQMLERIMIWNAAIPDEPLKDKTHAVYGKPAMTSIETLLWRRAVSP